MKEIMHILLRDIHMPEMDGLSLVKKIRQTNETLPIVMITAHTNKEYLLEAVELHIRHIL